MNGAPREALRRIAEASPHTEDELLAERLELALEGCSDSGASLSLMEIVEVVPLLRSRPISLDAAIDAALRCLLAQGLTPAEAEGRLLEDAPEFGEAIRQHMELRSLMATSRTGENRGLPEVEPLPAPFGPMLGDGRRRYELVEYLGGGSEGRVYRAFDRQLAADGRPLEVAVKRLHARPDVRADRAVREASRAVRVRHPSVAALLDVGVTEEGPYLVYEFAEGVTLERWRCNREVPTARECADLVRRVAEGVQAAHNAGVAHRDLKPNNVVVSESGRVRITDFGLAAALSSESEAHGGGSFAFGAPEQLRGGAGGTDAAVDVYALGGLLYWLLTGQYPNGQTVDEVQRRLHSHDRFPLLRFEPASGRERTLRAICARALAPEPSARHSSAGLLATELERWLSFEPVLPHDASALRRAMLAARRSPAAAMVVVAAMAALVGAGVYAWRLDVGRWQRELDMERELLAERDRRIENAQGTITAFIRTLEQMEVQRMDESWLPVLSLAENLGETELFADAALSADFSKARVALARGVLEKAEAEGTRDTVEMAFWEMALAYWLVLDERFWEAGPVASESADRIARLLPANDPWVAAAQSLKHVTIARVAPLSEEGRAAGAWIDANLERLPNRIREVVQRTRARAAEPGARTLPVGR